MTGRIDPRTPTRDAAEGADKNSVADSTGSQPGTHGASKETGGHSRGGLTPVSTLSDAAPQPAPDAMRSDDDLDRPLFFEPSGDGMAACIHDADGYIFCEAQYDDFKDNPSFPERVMKRLVERASAPVPSPDGARWRHRKRGTTYTEIGRGNLQIATDPVEEDDRVVIYRSDVDGRIWVRGEAEFQDGRFEAIAPSATGAEPVAWTKDQIYFAARSLALTNPDAYEDKTHKGSLRPNQKALDAALRALGAAVRYDSAIPPVRGDREAIADDIRAHGWTVAVHNDYRQGGEAHTFWLFTNGRKNAKGEGKTDAEALNQVRAALSLPVQPGADLTFAEKHLLRSLMDGPREDRDCTPERVLINSGLAERFDPGQIRLTEAGRARWRDLHNEDLRAK